MRQRVSVSASSTLADDPRQIILNTLKFVECRLRCAAQKGVAVVESGGDYTARECPTDVVVAQGVIVVIARLGDVSHVDDEM